VKTPVLVPFVCPIEKPMGRIVLAQTIDKIWAVSRGWKKDKTGCDQILRDRQEIRHGVGHY
jgi:hypothetical protein